MANGGDLRLTDENQSLFYSIRYYTTLTPQETATCTQSLFKLMTSNEEDGGAQFREMVSRSDLRNMAVLLTSDLDRLFLAIARNKNGSNRMQELLGKSEDADIFFFDAIMSRFVHVMTDYEASRVGRQGMHVFSQARTNTMLDNVLRHAVHLACDRTGYVVLKKIIDGLGNLYSYRDRLLDIVAQNALRLSYHVHGNYVVQHVLRLHDLRCTHNVGVSLSGHCFRLSFTKTGTYVVQKLLDTEEAGDMVVEELLHGCDEESLVRLARSDYGSYVVVKALRVMRERNRMDLANKLMPYVRRLHGRGSKIAAFLYSLS